MPLINNNISTLKLCKNLMRLLIKSIIKVTNLLLLTFKKVKNFKS